VKGYLSVRKAAILILLPLVFGCGKKQEKKDYSVTSMIADLKSTDPDVRYTATSVLKSYGPEARSAVPALTEALRDPNRNVRIGAAYALADIGPDAKTAVPALQSASKDIDKDVRDAAEYALKQLQGKGEAAPR
jgi:HEAT repeat protein